MVNHSTIIVCDASTNAHSKKCTARNNIEPIVTFCILFLFCCWRYLYSLEYPPEPRWTGPVCTHLAFSKLYSCRLNIMHQIGFEDSWTQIYYHNETIYFIIHCTEMRCVALKASVQTYNPIRNIKRMPYKQGKWSLYH